MWCLWFDVGVRWRALCGLPSGKNGGLCCPHLVLRVHSTDNNVTAYQGKKKKKSLASTGFLCGQGVGSEDYRCVGTFLNVNECVLTSMLGTSLLLFWVIYFTLMRKEKCVVFEWHSRQLHHILILVKHGSKKDHEEGISLNISRLGLTKTWLYLWMAN